MIAITDQDIDSTTGVGTIKLHNKISDVFGINHADWKQSAKICSCKKEKSRLSTKK